MDVPDKLTVKVTFLSKDPMDAENIPVLKEQTKRVAFIRTAVFCYVKGVSTNGDTSSEHQRFEVNTKIDEKVFKLNDELDFLDDLKGGNKRNETFRRKESHQNLEEENPQVQMQAWLL